MDLMLVSRVAFGCGALLAVAGCRSGSSDVPQVIDLGGKELVEAKVQLIAYAEDPFATDVEAFIKEFGTTDEWATQTKEYGVGPFTTLPTVLIPGTPPASLDDNTGTVTPFEDTIINSVSGTDATWAPEDGSTMYVYLLPLGTEIISGGTCCNQFLGYHWGAPLASGSVAPYSVICHCPAQVGDPITPLQLVTTTVSHEMVETATDPFVSSSNGAAYAQTDDADIVWTLATGGEIADMCELNADSNYLPPGATYMIQRVWSNAAARAGDDPCVPVASSAPYFNSYASLSDSITLQYEGGPVSTTGVKIPVGGSGTVDVTLTSQGATAGPWTVKAWDLNAFLGNPANTSVMLDKTSGSDGDVLHLTITVQSYDSLWGGAGFVLESTLGTQDNLTMGAIGE